MTLATSTDWNLQIKDLTEKTIAITHDDILASPKTTVFAELYCYDRLVARGDWSGIKISDLLSQAGINPVAGSIDFLAGDGYIVTIPIETAMRPDVIIAYEIDGNSLPENLRLVIPGANGNLWISMIRSITMSATQIGGGESLDLDSEAMNQLHGLTNATRQASAQQQPQVQPQPTTPDDKTTINPTTPPTNATQPQPVQEATKQQNSSSQGSEFPVELVYWVALGVVVAVVAVSFVVYRRKRTNV